MHEQRRHGLQQPAQEPAGPGPLAEHQAAEHHGQRRGRPGDFEEHEEREQRRAGTRGRTISQAFSAAAGAIPASAASPSTSGWLPHDDQRQVEHVEERPFADLDQGSFGGHGTLDLPRGCPATGFRRPPSAR